MIMSKISVIGTNVSVWHKVASLWVVPWHYIWCPGTSRMLLASSLCPAFLTKTRLYIR